jgi:hypothetical protein
MSNEQPITIEGFSLEMPPLEYQLSLAKLAGRLAEREQCCQDVCDLCGKWAVDRRMQTWLHKNPNNGLFDEVCLAAPIRERHYRQAEAAEVE